MKILVVSSYLPYPLYSGGHIRLYNLLKQLSLKHEITLICEKRDYQTKEDVLEMEKICKKVITVKRRKQWAVQNIIKTGLSFNPFLVVGHTSKDMKQKIRELLNSGKFDLIHVETFYVMQNLPKTSIPVVLAEHNIEYLVYKRYLDRKPLFIKLSLYLDILKIKRLEEKFWRQADKLIAVSEEEKKLMGREDVVVIPNGVDIEKFRIQNSEFRIKRKERKILFIGDFRWMQNRDAAEWILKEIWPKIIFNFQFSIFNKFSNSKLKLWIVGRDIPESIKNLSKDDSVIFDENNQESAPEIFRSADILLSPIRIGGGTSYKILEAMASGIPVITTNLGIEGIDVRSGEDILVSDRPEEIAKMAINLLENKKLYNEISLNARSLIEEKYDWKMIAGKLEEVYESVIK